LKKVEYLVREVRDNQDEISLARIFSECFGPTTRRQVTRWIRRAKKESVGKFKSFVAELEGEVVSNVTVETKKLHVGEGVHIETGGIAGVCTCSDYRRRGIVTNLFEQCIEYLENSGFSNSSLYTGKMLPAHRIYRRKNFDDMHRFEVHVKFLDFDSNFRTWLRNLNRYIKLSKVAQTTLQGWDRSVVLLIEGEKPQCFQYSQNHFKRLGKRPRYADIEIATSVETLTRVMWGETEIEEAMEMGKVKIKKGTKVDLRYLRKILTGIWDE